MFSVILEKPVVHAQVATFMKSPYFGTKAVSVVFDHEYPVYDLEDNGNPYEGDPRTVVHRDGVSWSIVESQRCIGYSGHPGIDYTMVYDYVLAAHDGQVIAAGWQVPQNRRADLGLRVEIEI